MHANTWAMLCHLGGLTGYLFNGLGSIVVPVILWALRKDQSAEVDYHGKEAINFNISVMFYMAALIGLTFVSAGIGFILTGPALLAVAILHFACTILAAVKANRGQVYRYPLTIRLIR